MLYDLVLCRPHVCLYLQCMHACNVKGKSESNVSLFVCGFPRTHTPRPVCTTYWPQRTYYDSKISLESCVSYACAYFSEAYESFVVRHKNFFGGQITDNQMEGEGGSNSDGVGKEERKSLVLRQNQTQNPNQCQCQRDQLQEEGRVTGGKGHER